MIKVRTKERDGSEVLVNIDNIDYIVPSLDGGSVIHFQTAFLVSLDSLDSIGSKIKVSRTPVQELYQGINPQAVFVPQAAVLTESDSIEKPVYDDGYPDHLPRLPTGNVDKRTNAYKDYIAGLGR